MKYKLDVDQFQEPHAPPPRKPFKTFFKYFIAIIMTFALTLFLLSASPKDVLSGFGDLIKMNDDTAQPKDFFYNTNSDYNVYIRGELDVEQLECLDKILEYEKSSCGLPLRQYDVNELAGRERVIIEAYGRWREVRRFFSSNSKPIYPSEREFYQ